MTTKIAAVVALAIALSGCSTVLPKKADLDKVHDTYRAEFAATFLADTEGNAGVCGAKPRGVQTSFPQTLQAIRDYEIKYRNDDSVRIEKGHLLVLKGMIHLQVGNTGIAESMIKDVQDAPLAASDDREVRDTLFKAAFAGLVKGWQAVCDLQKERSGGAYAFPAPAAANYIANLAQAGKGVIATAQASNIAGPATDEGAIYLATSGAIFDYYAYRVEADSCRVAVFGKPEAAVDCVAKAKASGLVRTGADAIARFLSEDEKKAAGSSSVASDWQKVVPVGRLQYVQWYSFLDREARSGQ